MYTFFLKTVGKAQEIPFPNLGLPRNMDALDDDVPQSVTLKSKEGQTFEIDRKFASISKLVKTAVDHDPDAPDVPIPSVTGPILKLVVDYMKHYKGTEPKLIPKPLRSKNMKDVVEDQWDAEFIDTIGDDRQQLYDLVMAANYMDIPSLLHLGCAKVASLIKGQPLEKIKDILSVKSAEEENKE